MKSLETKPLVIYAVIFTVGQRAVLSIAYPRKWKSRRECREYVEKMIPRKDRQFYRAAKLVEVRP